jgi:hypothetical protein
MEKISSREKNTIFDWSAGIGMALVVILICLLALNAAGGWLWTAKFLESSAPAWVQAVGSIAAIVAVFRVSQAQYQHQLQRDNEIERRNKIQKLKAIVALIQGVGEKCKDCSSKVMNGVGLMDVELRRLQSAKALLSAIPIMDFPDVLIVHIFSDVLERLHVAERMIEELETYPNHHSIETRKKMASAIKAVSVECFIGSYEIIGLIAAQSTDEEKVTGKATSFPRRELARKQAISLWETFDKESSYSD